MSFYDIEEIVTTSQQQPSQTEDIDDKLTIWKPKVLSALTCKIYLNPLHENLATKAELLTSLNSLYGDHPSHEIDFEIKETMAIPSAVGTRSTAYLIPLKPSSQKNKFRLPNSCSVTCFN